MIRFDRDDNFVTLNDRPILTGEFGLDTHVRRDWKFSTGSSFQIGLVKKYTYGFHGYGSFYYALLNGQGHQLSYITLGDIEFEDKTARGETLYSCSDEVTFDGSVDFSVELSELCRTVVLRYASDKDWFSHNISEYLRKHAVFLYEKALGDIVFAMAKDVKETDLLKAAIFTFFSGNSLDSIVFCLNSVLSYIETANGIEAKVTAMNDIEAWCEDKARKKGVIPDDFMPILW